VSHYLIISLVNVEPPAAKTPQNSKVQNWRFFFVVVVVGVVVARGFWFCYFFF